MKLAFLLSAVALSLAPSPSQAVPDLPPMFSPWGSPLSSRVLQPLGGGDTFQTATVITSLPFTDIGTTCGFADDYLPPCAAWGNSDVVYRYAPATDQCVDVSLCGSNFDTAVALYTNGPDSVNCNNDACNWSSRLSHRTLHAGDTYYLVIDGNGVACGTYHLSIATCCDLPACPADAIQESEPCCLDPALGCTPGPVINLSCAVGPVHICGTYNATKAYRDVDMVPVQVTEPSVLSLDVQAASPTLIAILSASFGSAVPLCARYSSANCVTTSCAAAVPAGTYWFYVAPTDFDGIPCGTPYTMTVSCTPQDATAAALLHGNDANGVPLLAGQTVRVVGTVTGQWPTASGSRFTLQDGTGGIAVIGAPVACVGLSDQVLVSGVVGQVNGWTAIVPPMTVDVLNPAGVIQPSAAYATPELVNGEYRSDGIETLESSLVQLSSVGIRHPDLSPIQAGETFAAGATYQVYTLKSGIGCPMRVLADANGCGISNPLVGSAIPTNCALDVGGVLAQFDATAGHRSGYAIVPRFPADLARRCSTPAIATTWGALKAHYR